MSGPIRPTNIEVGIGKDGKPAVKTTDKDTLWMGGVIIAVLGVLAVVAQVPFPLEPGGRQVLTLFGIGAIALGVVLILVWVVAKLRGASTPAS